MKRKLASLLTFLTFAGLAPGSSSSFAATLYTTTVLEDQPVAYWHFDEADGNATQQAPVGAAPVTTENDLIPNDSAARVNHATLGTGLRLGQAADFAGSGFFRAPTLRAAQSTLAGAWAIELWFQSQAENAATYLANFGPTGGDNSPAVIYGFNPEYLEIYAGGGGRTGTTGPALNDQSWHHLLFVYYGDGTDGVAPRLDAYLDGNAFPYLDAVSKRLNLTSLIVGAALAGGQNAFTGRLDELAVYDLSHLPDETAIETHVTQLVSTHMASAAAASGEPYANVVLAHQPSLYWNFDETEGSAKQLAPITFPTPDNTLNDLVAAGNALRVTHSAIASGLELGNAIDLDGTSSFQRLGGLDVGQQILPSPWILELWFQFTGDQANRYLLNMGRGGYYNSPAVIYGYFGSRLEVFGNGRSSDLGPEVNDRNWHHLLVVNYNTAPSGAAPANRVDFFIDNLQHPNVGGGFNQPVDFADWLIFGAALPDGVGGLIGRLDELAIYRLNDLTTVEAIEARAADLAARHYAAAFGSTSVGVITLTSQPADATATLGQTVSFSVTATVTGTTEPLRYQWLRNGVAITGAESATYTTPPLALYDVGTTLYTVRVSAGPVFKLSNPATLTVPAPPTPLTTAYTTQVLADQPLLYWNFDEMTGLASQLMPITASPITTQNDLVPFGLVPRVRHADLGQGLDKLGNAIYLDGFSYMSVASLQLGKPALDGPWIAEFWMQMDGEFGFARNQYMANFGPAGADNSPAFIHGYNVDRLEVFAGASGRSGVQGPFLADNDWHHIVWVNYNTAPANASPANRVEVFIDGTLYPDAGGGFNRAISLTRLLFGAATVAPVNAFTGSLDEFALYDLTGLSVEAVETKATRIATNHSSVARTPGGQTYAATVLAEEPLFYYNFDEADGNARQLVPITLPPPDPAKNHLAASTAGRVQHSAIQSGLFLGNAADFDGKGYFSTPQLEVGRPQLAAPWAVEFWLQVQGVNETERQNYLLNFGNNAPAFIYDYKPDELEIFAGVRTDLGPVISDATWHHVLWVFYGDGLVGVADRADAYLDGVAIPYVRNTFSNPLNLSSTLLVGSAIPGYNGFQGRIDEIAVYDLSALSSEAAIEARAAELVASHRTAATQPPPQPAELSYQRTGNTLTLTWSVTGYTLQQATDAANPSGWTDVAGGNTSPVNITLPPTGAAYYRLRR
jgi:hypothetical protein